jgi:hypothetical protein
MADNKNGLILPYKVPYLLSGATHLREEFMGSKWASSLSCEGLVQEQRRKEKAGKIAITSERRRERRQRLGLFVKHYWHRLMGAAVGWFAWDFYYCKPRLLTLSLHFQHCYTEAHAKGHWVQIVSAYS